MHVRLWEFVVRPDAVSAFVERYGPNGPWVAYFAAYDGYLGTELLSDASDGTRFLTVDRWDRADSYDRVDTGAEAWRMLDAAGEELTERETFLGAFDTVPGDARR